MERGDLLAGRQRLRSAPSPGDLWSDLDAESCGIVASVRSDVQGRLLISIRHLRPDPARISLDDFYVYFNGRGCFFR